MICLLLLFLAFLVVGCRRHPAAKKSAAKSPSGRTLTRSASRAASRGSSPQAAVYALPDADKVKIAAAAAAHYQPLDAKYPDSVRALSVSRGYSDSSPDFSTSRLVGASARDKSVEHNNGSGNIGSLRHSERISSRAQSVEPSAQGVQVKPSCAKWCKQWCKQWLCHTTDSNRLEFFNQSESPKHRRSSLASPKPSAEKFGEVHQR